LSRKKRAESKEILKVRIRIRRASAQLPSFDEDRTVQIPDIYALIGTDQSQGRQREAFARLQSRRPLEPGERGAPVSPG
jgi:hypothetical protein